MHFSRTRKPSLRRELRRAGTHLRLALIGAVAACALCSCAQPRSKSAPAPVIEVPATTVAAATAPAAPAATPKPRAPPKTASVAKKTLPAIPAAEAGYYLDVMQGRLKQAAGADGTISRFDNRIVVATNANFDPASARLQIDAERNVGLAAVAKTLVEYRSTRVAVRVRSVDGAADASDAASAQACTQALTRYLQGAGVAAEQLSDADATRGSTPARTLAVKSARVELSIEPVVRSADTTP